MTSFSCGSDREPQPSILATSMCAFRNCAREGFTDARHLSKKASFFLQSYQLSSMGRLEDVSSFVIFMVFGKICF
jgi:hypothetical protein